MTRLRCALWRQPRHAAPGWCLRVSLIRFHGSPRPPPSACGQRKLQTFFDGAGLALCCTPCRVGRDMPVGLLLVSRIGEAPVIGRVPRTVALCLIVCVISGLVAQSQSATDPLQLLFAEYLRGTRFDGGPKVRRRLGETSLTTGGVTGRRPSLKNELRLASQARHADFRAVGTCHAVLPVEPQNPKRARI